MKRAILLLTLVFTSLAFAQNEELFEDATAAYNKGEYEKAIETYQEILSNGQHSASLYYNLGNSHYKLNQIAPSIYYYEKALLLDPGDKDTKQNLAFAQQMTIDDIKPNPQSGLAKIYNNIIGILSFDQWAYTAVILVILFVLGYLAYYFLTYSSQKRVAFIGSMASLMLAIVAVVFAYVQFENYSSEQPAIVFAIETKVKSEPNDRSSEVFILHEGTKVEVLDGLEDYKKIELADGKSGWVQENDIKLLKDF